MSVWGTGYRYLRLRGFSWKRGINHFVSVKTRRHVSTLNPRICLRVLPTSFPQHYRSLVHLAFSVTSSWFRNINLIPIDYAFQPRLRGRLTLRRLALRRKPWTFGENVSHILYRYLCQHSHFRYLQHPLQDAFTGLRNAPLPLICLHMNPHLRYMTLAPLHCRRRKT